MPVAARRHVARALRIAGFVIVVAATVTVGVAAFGRPERACPVPSAGPLPADAAALSARLERRLERFAPSGVWVTIDTYRNRITVMRGKKVLREAACSTGSGVLLKDPSGERQWVFQTPLGERRVLNKRKNPVWKKPDWAFIEEGFEPPRDWSLRTDDFSLGDYALDLGDGYLIHGTIFQTLLGRPVTHGCIRVGDKDLEYVYRTVPYGARVYLF